MAPPVESLRRRAYLALEGGQLGGTAGAAVEAALIALIVLNVAAYTLQSMPRVEGAFGGFFAGFEAVSIAVFAAEYAMRLWTAPEDPAAGERGEWRGRLYYAFTPLMLIDLLGFAPSAIAFFLPFVDLRLLRLFRLVRLLKIARYSPALAALANVLMEERRALYGSLLLFACALILFAAAMHAAEGTLQPRAFGTIPDAMWWAVSTLTTVGYGDTVPLTTLGRMIAGLAMIVGLGLVALPVGIVATGFANSIHRRDFVVTFGMLARVPMFQGLDAQTVSDVMDHLRAYTVRAGDIISLHGETAAAIYFVVAGEVDARLANRTVRFGSGDFFGELADTGDALKEAVIVAASPARLLELSSSDFEHLARMHPGLREQMQRRSRPDTA